MILKKKRTQQEKALHFQLRSKKSEIKKKVLLSLVTILYAIIPTIFISQQ